MNIAVIASNGRSGQSFVMEALAAGHNVRAGMRKTSSSRLRAHPNLIVVECDATNADQIRSLLQGQDAVASFIGHVKGSDPDVQTAATHQLVAVMSQLGLKRIVSLTGTGVRFPGDIITLVDRFLNLGIRFIDPARIQDGKNHVVALQKSNLDWTIIRVLKLQNTKAATFALREHGPTKWYVSRQEVAKAALQVLEQGSFIRQAPIIGKPI